MSALKLDGKNLSAISEDSIKNRVGELSKKNINPTLATILVGNDPASETYVKMKRNTCARVGMKSIAVELSETTTTEELLNKIHEVLSWPATNEQVKAASKLVPDDVVQRCTASGTPEEAKAKVKEYLDAGCTSPILYPLGPDVQLMIDSFSDWKP